MRKLTYVCGGKQKALETTEIRKKGRLLAFLFHYIEPIDIRDNCETAPRSMQLSSIINMGDDSFSVNVCLPR